jgi:hypothetical protein
MQAIVDPQSIENLNAETKDIIASDAKAFERDKAAKRIRLTLLGIAKILHKIGEVKVFCSFSNGFKTGSSDLDVVFVGVLGPDSTVSVLGKFASVAPDFGFENVTTVFQANVPMLKLTDRRASMEFDFCIMSETLRVLNATGSWNAVYPPGNCETYFLKTWISHSVTPHALLEKFAEFDLIQLFFPKFDGSGRARKAFLQFKSAAGRRQAHTNNEGYVADCQLCLHYSSHRSLEEYALSHGPLDKFDIASCKMQQQVLAARRDMGGSVETSEQQWSLEEHHSEHWMQVPGLPSRPPVPPPYEDAIAVMMMAGPMPGGPIPGNPYAYPSQGMWCSQHQQSELLQQQQSEVLQQQQMQQEQLQNQRQQQQQQQLQLPQQQQHQYPHQPQQQLQHQPQQQQQQPPQQLAVEVAP